MHELLFQTFHKAPKMQSKKILITGAAGFIGFHAVKRLSAEGYEIVGIYNLCLSNKAPHPFVILKTLTIADKS